MKKIIFALVAFFVFNASTWAQAVKQAPAKATESKMKAVPASSAKVVPMAKPAQSGVVLKKDGTPDKRYNNATAVPLKKDGTPDKRYKANKKS